MTRREAYQEYLKSEHWKALRKAAVEKWGSRCPNCDSVTGIEVHHLIYRDWYSCTTDDLMPLCGRCHGLVHKSGRLSELLESALEPAQRRREVMTFLAGADLALRQTVKPGGSPYFYREAERRREKKRRQKWRRQQEARQAQGKPWASWAQVSSRGRQRGLMG